jgi:hypothetical protein
MSIPENQRNNALQQAKSRIFSVFSWKLADLWLLDGVLALSNPDWAV